MSSKLPHLQDRLNNDRPPRKSRKVLGENGEVINIPSFSKNLLSVETDQYNNNMIKTKDDGLISNIPRRIGVFDKAKKSGLNIGSNLVDPEALRRRHDNTERALKVLNVSKDKLDSLNKKLIECKVQMEQLFKNKNSIIEDSDLLQRNSDNLDVETNNLEAKIERAQKSLDSSKIYEERMFALRFTEIKNQKLREMDEIKNQLDNKLKELESFNDEELKEQINDLKKQIKMKENERIKVYEQIDTRLLERKKALEEELEQVVKFEESKNEQFTENFEAETNTINKLKETLKTYEIDVENVKHQIKALDKDIEDENQLQGKSELEMSELLKELQLLEDEEKLISLKLEITSRNHQDCDETYTLSKSKIEKEKNLRRRIQNSIEEYNGKLRTYVKFHSKDQLNIEQDNSGVEYQSITVDDQLHKFNRFFQNEPGNVMIGETITLTEYVLKGVNFAALLINSESSFTSELIESTMRYWKDRSSNIGRYQNYRYEYTFQLFQFDNETQTFRDSLNNEKVEISYEPNLESNSSIIQDFDSWNKLHGKSIRSNTITFTNVIVKRVNTEKTVVSNCLFVEIPRTSVDEEFKQMLRSLTKSGMELNSSLHKFIQYIYKNWKTLSIFDIELKDSTDLNLLKVAKAVSIIDNPTKRASNINRPKSKS